MNEQVYAICKKTYPDETDMQEYADGTIDLDEICIYIKGEKYLVNDQCDKEYWEIINPTESEE